MIRELETKFGSPNDGSSFDIAAIEDKVSSQPPEVE